MAQQPIDIIVTDIFMPEMDGIQLLEHLHASSAYCRIPVIAITEHDESVQEKVLALGAREFITQPFSSDIICNRVQSVMQAVEYENAQYNKTRKMLLDSFLDENMPGGMIGGYVAEGFPLYFVNAPMLEYLGYATEPEFCSAINGMAANSIIEEDRAATVAQMQQQLHTQGKYRVEYRMRKKDGSCIWVDATGKKCRQKMGERPLSACALILHKST